MHRSFLLPLFIASFLAILSLTSCGSGRRAAMLAVLDEADSLNRNYIPLTNDTALLDAVCDGFPRSIQKFHSLFGS